MTAAPHTAADVLIDVDQHLYETDDAFTRYLDPAFQKLVSWAEVDGRRHLLMNDRVVRAGIRPAHDWVPEPGRLSEYFRGNNPTGASARELVGDLIACRPEFTDRAARVAALDAQGVTTAVVNPQTGLAIEEILKLDVPAMHAIYMAYLRWTNEHWGFHRDDRILVPALISLIDPECAEAQLRYAVDHGAKLVVFRPGPVVGPFGSFSPADPRYDRFWSMVEDSGTLVAFHIAESSVAKYAGEWGEGQGKHNFQQLFSAFSSVLSLYMERPIFDTVAALITQGLFDRHPRLRVLTIELGAGWVPELLRRFRTVYGQNPRAFSRDPLETFRDHIWVTPFQEDDISQIVDLIGADRVMFGSDWPHPEGVSEPRQLLAELEVLDPADRKRVTSENFFELVGR